MQTHPYTHTYKDTTSMHKEREREREAGDVMELETGRQSTGKVVPG